MNFYDCIYIYMMKWYYYDYIYKYIYIIYIDQETHKTQQDECQVLKWYYHIIPCKKQWVFSHNVSQQASAPPQKYIVSQVRNEEKLSWKSKQHKTHLAKEKACAKKQDSTKNRGSRYKFYTPCRQKIISTRHPLLCTNYRPAVVS